MHEALRPLDEVRPLREPVLIAAFSGWNDFGGAAVATLDHLAELWGARDLAEIPPEPFFDFTVQRPVVRLEGDQRVIDWPTPTFRVASPKGAERDFVLLTGAEPHLRWRTFTDAVADLMREVGATTSITIAAQAAAIPHTRPLPVTLSASDPEFETQFGLKVPESRYEGPTGIVGVLNVLQRHRGWRNASLWAQIPHYLTVGPNPNAIAALVEVARPRLRHHDLARVHPGPGRALRRSGAGGDDRVERSRVLHPPARGAVRRERPAALTPRAGRRRAAPGRGPAHGPRELPS